MSGDSQTADVIPQSVQLTIRCAFQTVEDQTIAASTSWTVKQLKEEIRNVHPSPPTTMKLIYGGHCLQDERTLKSIFEQVPPVVDGPTVFHLVGPLPRTEPQIRQRNVPTSRPGIQDPSTLPSYQQLLQNWANFTPAAPPSLTTGQDYMEYYRNYVNYCRAHQQMMASQVAGAVPNPFPHAVYINNGMGVPMMPYFVNPAQTQPINLTAGNNQPIVMNAIIQNPPVNPQQPVAPQAPERGVGGFVEDGLDLFYKGIRVLFILSAVLLYSTLERFLLVIGIVLVILFIQYRRSENRRAAANAQPVNNNNAGEQQAENRQHQRNEGEAEGTVNEPLAEQPVPPPAPASFQAAFSTIYSFVTSFITSLVPDHHIPVDVN